MTKIFLTSLLCLLLFQSCRKDSEVIQPTLERLIPFSSSDTIQVAFKPKVNVHTGNWDAHITLGKAVSDRVMITVEWESNNQPLGIYSIIAANSGVDNLLIETSFPVINPIYNDPKIISVTCDNPQFHFVF
jgi:hypothetical protein